MLKLLRVYSIISIVAVFIFAACSNNTSGFEAKTRNLEDFKPNLEEDILKESPKSTTINVERMERFWSNIHLDNYDRVRIVSYTDEGAPVLETLYYSDQMLFLHIDTSYDPLAGERGIIKYDCERLLKKEKKDQIQFSLTGCKEPKTNEFVQLEDWIIFSYKPIK